MIMILGADEHEIWIITRKLCEGNAIRSVWSFVNSINHYKQGNPTL